MFEMSFQVHCYYNNLHTRTATCNGDPSIQDAQFSVGPVVAEQLFVLAAAMPIPPQMRVYFYFCEFCKAYSTTYKISQQ